MTFDRYGYNGCAYYCNGIPVNRAMYRQMAEDMPNYVKSGGTVGFALYQFEKVDGQAMEKLMNELLTMAPVSLDKIIAGSFRAGAASHRPLANPNCPKSFASNTFCKREKGLPPVCDSQIGGYALFPCNDLRQVWLAFLKLLPLSHHTARLP